MSKKQVGDSVLYHSLRGVASPHQVSDAFGREAGSRPLAKSTDRLEWLNERFGLLLSPIQIKTSVAVATSSRAHDLSLGHVFSCRVD